MSKKAPDNKPSTGRFKRLAKLASLSARLSTDVMSRGVKRLAGRDESMLGAGAAEKLVATLGDMKGLAMKMGQAMAMDPDMLSPEVRAVIARLQNQAPSMSWPTVHRVLTQSLGRPPEEAFASFDQTPLAAASLGQVHRAVTLEGAQVAVKVQYPDIAKALKSDLDNLSVMVDAVSLSTRMLHGRSYFAELRESLEEELDYREEGRRAQRFAQAALGVPGLVVPRVYDELTSEFVLTMELLEGSTLKEFLEHLDQHGNEERFRVASLLLHAIWGPLLKDGVIHGDPHPGNFLLLPDGRMGVLDFGAIKALEPHFVDVNRRLFESVFDGTRLDSIELSLESGFTFDDAEVARPVVDGVLNIITRAARTEDFDYATAGINRDLKAHFLKSTLKLAGIKPPREAVLFFRGIGGLSQNLENLGARGNYRSVYEQLLRLRP